MNIRLQIIVAAALLIFLYVLGRMIKKRKIELRYALAWLLLAIVTLILDIFPGLMKVFANLLGIASPTNMLFFAGFCFALIIIFVLTSAVSRMSVQIKDLTQKLALMEKSEREKAEKGDTDNEEQ